MSKQLSDIPVKDWTYSNVCIIYSAGIALYAFAK